MNLPKRWLIHSITYAEINGKDSYGNAIFKEPLTIKYTRVDNATVFSRDSTDTRITANAVVFVDAVNSTNQPLTFVEESKITFNGHDYVLKKIVDCYYPKKNEIRHYELELI